MKTHGRIPHFAIDGERVKAATTRAEHVKIDLASVPQVDAKELGTTTPPLGPNDEEACHEQIAAAVREIQRLRFGGQTLEREYE